MSRHRVPETKFFTKNDNDEREGAEPRAPKDEEEPVTPRSVIVTPEPIGAGVALPS